MVNTKTFEIFDALTGKEKTGCIKALVNYFLEQGLVITKRQATYMFETGAKDFYEEFGLSKMQINERINFILKQSAQREHATAIADKHTAQSKQAKFHKFLKGYFLN